MRHRHYFLISALVLVLDQATKIAAHAWLPQRGAVEVIPNFLNLWYQRNPGGLFGYFGELATPYRIALLAVLPFVAIGMMIWFLLHEERTDRTSRLGIALILGGAVGNLIDRLVRGEVVDFLDVYAPPGAFADWLRESFGTVHWPTFNLADSAILCGAVLLLFQMIRGDDAGDEDGGEAAAGALDSSGDVPRSDRLR